MPMPGVSTTTTSSTCSECGTIAKSGKISCCGRGGSWFGQCGGVGNESFAHSWYEGIRTCKIQKPQSVVSQQMHHFSSKSIGVVSTNQTSIRSMHSTWSDMFTTALSHAPATASSNALKSGKQLHVVNQIVIALIIIPYMCWKKSGLL